MIYCGDDFPKSTEQRLRNWNVSLTIRKESNQFSTRGLLEYRDPTFGREKSLLAINTSLLTDPVSSQRFQIHNSPPLSHGSRPRQHTSSQIKIISLPEKSGKALLTLRENSGVHTRPLLIWEPHPLSCISSNLDSCLSAVQSVDIFSPNHLELAALFSIPTADTSNKHVIEDLATKVLSHGVGPDGKGTVVIRAGEHGCLILAKDIPATWLPPFYPFDSEGKQDGKVIDATGAGNAFLGAFAIGLLKTGDRMSAACYGAVGASFALEQVGMPMLGDYGQDDESWNGVHVLTRLQEYLSARALR